MTGCLLCRAADRRVAADQGSRGAKRRCRHLVQVGGRPPRPAGRSPTGPMSRSRRGSAGNDAVRGTASFASTASGRQVGLEISRGLCRVAREDAGLVRSARRRPSRPAGFGGPGRPWHRHGGTGWLCPTRPAGRGCPSDCPAEGERCSTAAPPPLALLLSCLARTVERCPGWPVRQGEQFLADDVHARESSRPMSEHVAVLADLGDPAPTKSPLVAACCVAAWRTSAW
jgi:hypothetical protein